MSEKIAVATVQEITDPGSRSFSYTVNGKELEGFVVLKNGVFSAYENKCPHTGAPLDWVEHQFLDADKELIQCAVHDARFEIETGECIFGPCVGQGLTRLVVRAEEQTVYLLVD